MKRHNKDDRRRSERVPETAPVRVVWDRDRRTLNRAWLEYHKLPLADRIFQRFGQWFWNRYEIEGLKTWPELFYEKRPARAFELLSNLVDEKNNKK
jgi:hypothetical protein